MEYLTPPFTREMMKTHKILIPNMSAIQFGCLEAALRAEGFDAEMLNNAGSEVAQLGLKYVHNDTCYPALLVIGQYLDALNSGKYDLEHTALLISQTGGGCRASNYINLLRKALVKSGYGNIPVGSVNISGLESDSSLPLTLSLVRRCIAAAEYGDLIFTLRNQTKPYETMKGDTEAMVTKWMNIVEKWMYEGTNLSLSAVKKNFSRIAEDFASIPVKRVPKVKVGVVGEIYVKFSPLGNNDLLNFLESQDCEVNMPGLMGFAAYCIANMSLDVQLYGGSFVKEKGADVIFSMLDSFNIAMGKALRDNGYSAPGSFKELMELPEGIISLGAKMGEGWLLTAEMVELIKTGYPNIVCAQPFGCLPNHIAGKGVINRIRQLYPEANITPVDYDPSATKVNQENRIKLMLSVAKEKLEQN